MVLAIDICLDLMYTMCITEIIFYALFVHFCWKHVQMEQHIAQSVKLKFAYYADSYGLAA